MKVPVNRDPARWRVYADWLVDRGNPHGDRLNRMLDSERPLAGIEELPGPVRALEAATFLALRLKAHWPLRHLALGHTRVETEEELHQAVAAGARSLEMPDTLLVAVAPLPVTDLWPVDVQTWHTPEMLVPLPHVRRMAIRLADGLGHDTLEWLLDVAGNLKEAHLTLRDPTIDLAAIRASHPSLQRITWRTGASPRGIPACLPAVGRDQRPTSGPAWWPGDLTEHGVVLDRMCGSAEGAVYRVWEPGAAAVRFVTRGRRSRVVPSEPIERPSVEHVARVEHVGVVGWAWAATSEQGIEKLSNHDRWAVTRRGRVAVLDGFQAFVGDEDVQQVLGRALAEESTVVEAMQTVDAWFRDQERETAATCAAIDVSTGDLAWSGDVRVGRLREDVFSWLTRDHTLAQVHADAPLPEHYRHILMRMVGVGDEPVEHSTVDVRPGDRLWVCSKGLWEALDDGALHALLRQEARLDELVAQLAAEARRCGGARTDITVVVADVHGARDRLKVEPP